MKFTHKVIGSVIALMLVSLTGVSYLLYHATQTNTEKLINDSIDEITASVASDIDNRVYGKYKLARYLISDMGEDTFFQSLQDKFDNPLIEENFKVGAFNYADDGSSVGSASWKVGDEYDARQMDWFNKAIAERSIKITEPFFELAAASMVVGIVSPVYQRDHLEGAFIFDLPLNELSEMVSKISIADGAGSVFVVSNENNIVAHSDHSLVGKPLDRYLKNLKISSDVLHREIDGKMMRIGFIALKDLPWHIVYVLNEDKAMASIEFVRDQAIVFEGITLTLSILILLILIRFLMRPLGILNQAIHDISSGEGDLTRRLNTNLDKEFSDLSVGFNLFMSKLQAQIQETKRLANKIKDLTGNTDTETNKATQYIANQQHELEFLSTAMQQMTSSASEVAANTQEVSQATEEALHSTQSGYGIVEKTNRQIKLLSERLDSAVDVVTTLEVSTGKIESILGVISDISEQTNLLALNAAIEAARAGEKGRGFAVVADEVRSLAQRTQASTTQIGAMIEELQSNTAKMVTIMNESKSDVQYSVTSSQAANDALAEIFSAMTQSSDMLTRIAKSAEEQSSVVKEVNNNTNNVLNFSNEILTVMQSTQTHCQMQIALTQEQNNLVDNFKV